jgi:hypothetical protein
MPFGKTLEYAVRLGAGSASYGRKDHLMHEPVPCQELLAGQRAQGGGPRFILPRVVSPIEEEDEGCRAMASMDRRVIPILHR